MLDSREDVAGPHPPKIMNSYMPILGKFGDLSEEDNLEILVDHVCTFVERNTVPWNDKHGNKLAFDRESISDSVSTTCDILRLHRFKTKKIENAYYLLGIFDELYNIYALENDKRTWVCKAMDMSKYHDLLINFYHTDRLRYIYLVRDPRDVALSFMKTPEGDCHYYTIANKWVTLQNYALKILSENEDLVHQVRYEALLQNKEITVEGLNEFIGQQKFGKVMRRGSIQVIKRVSGIISGAKSGEEAKKAAVLSYKFKNLTRGKSFAKTQFQKWLTGPEPISQEDLLCLESILFETMSRLGYKPHIVVDPSKKLVFDPMQVLEFKSLNKIGVENMMEKLRKDDPDDFYSRKYQADVLDFPPELIKREDEADEEENTEEEIDYTKTEEQRKYPYNWPTSARKYGYLTSAEIDSRMETVETQEFELSGGYKLKVAALCQRGYYPTEKNKANQDSILLKKGTGKNQNNYVFAVFDGHGPCGDKVSQYAKNELFQKVENKHLNSPEKVKKALVDAHIEINNNLSRHKFIDDKLSGTTACSLYIRGRSCYISNVGDSQCILGSLQPSKTSLQARVLTNDHSPSRKDECDRIIACGGKVCTLAQLQEDDEYDEVSSEMPRVWSKDGPFPGTAFTRSIGDSIAESLGVYAKPELEHHEICSSDEIIVLCSDGVTEFMSERLIVSIASMYEDPLESCKALVGESYRRWMIKEERTDDISIILGFIEKPKETGKRIAAP
eukprot:CAMPEP_0113315184 /NCGR_PEP_ID=MMETSP0010_2-20120614/10952_1 /TAXON_ID=216773 ORGANISM="Corethron hystrix, Strain 308" /NCGR_SAMPLE_ID=MMETSP0010_2 /ASSEMBLY_ACC=CAM_ASM_000155 /LENGTH=729 /DNA_ID=CAMNT_0000171631 /DNA_START=54 /DNA_END=2243 /DNA_ORIENTATION=+ /assembly_acc=CAM_ASM_000155